MDEQRTKDWRELCEAVATEVDPAKFTDLITELTRALDQRNWKQKPTDDDVICDTNRHGICWRNEPAVW